MTTGIYIAEPRLSHLPVLQQIPDLEGVSLDGRGENRGIHRMPLNRGYVRRSGGEMSQWPRRNLPLKTWKRGNRGCPESDLPIKRGGEKEVSHRGGFGIVARLRNRGSERDAGNGCGVEGKSCVQ